jgi:hypothetical protein
MYTLRFLRYFILVSVSLLLVSFQPSSQLQWPEVSQQTKPWTRWWWMGSTVNKENLTEAMEEYKKAGLGGLEITPIYGVKGYEDNFIDYLSPKWIDMFMHTLEEGRRLDIGIDMATGTGWPFGGPWIDAEHACKYVTYKTYTLEEGQILSEAIGYIQVPLVRSIGKKVDISDFVEPIAHNKDLQELALEQVRFEKPLPLQVLMAYSDKGDVLDLTDKVDKTGQLNWTAPKGTWTLYAVFQGWHGKMVERAAPGGETNVIDHFSEKALNSYLKRFNQAFTGKDIKSLRAFFNDSYEVDDAQGQANWTPDLFIEFLNRRGYDLHNHLPALFGRETEEKNLRVLCDYRETISDLLLEKFTTPWQEWAVSKNAIIRNQAHGSPANILDLYAASDIPETEGEDLLGIKYASSAAHLSGKSLVSSESATWLDEHFLASLADVKLAIDRYFLGGVNHIFYHGTTFSPQNEAWPGWIFYASVHFGPTNTFWNDFLTLNKYVTCCQSFLQNSQPDNDILLYFPFYDQISQPSRDMLEHFSSRIPPFFLTEFRETAQAMLDHGYMIDYLSDTQIKDLNFDHGLLKSPGASYKTLVLPKCRFIPVRTFEKLIELAEKGAIIIIHKNLPVDVPGFGKLEERRKNFQSLLDKLIFKQINNSDISKAAIGSGAILLGNDLNELLFFAKIDGESMVDHELQFIRRIYEGNKLYFIVNWGETVVNGWIPLQTNAKSIIVFNPMHRINGMAEVRTLENDRNEVYLQLQPGESCILKTSNVPIEAYQYPYIEVKGEPQEITGEWIIHFITGGPDLPSDIKTNELQSWTNLGDDHVKAFSGMANYNINFKIPGNKADKWLLDLGDVRESAAVILNGEKLSTLITPPYRIIISREMMKENNQLNIKVSSLMANRIADLDREGIEWKKFYNINFPAKKRENRGKNGLFDASKWEPKESGLIGPVTLTPVEFKDFRQEQ